MFTTSFSTEYELSTVKTALQFPLTMIPKEINIEMFTVFEIYM